MCSVLQYGEKIPSSSDHSEPKSLLNSSKVTCLCRFKVEYLKFNVNFMVGILNYENL